MSLIKGVIVKTTAPSVNDDNTKGFYVGFKWTNSTTTTVYEAISVSTGAAVWKPLSISNNEIIVNQLNQLGTPSGGKYTLQANTKYIITTSINIGTDYIQLSENTTIEGISGFIGQIIYTGTGGAIRGTDVTSSISNVTLVATNGAGKVFDLSNVGKTKNFVLQECIIANSTEIGSINGFELVLINTVNNQSNTTGWTITGVNHFFFLDNFFASNNSGTYLSLPSGTFEDIIISRTHFDVPAARTGLNINAAVIVVTETVNIQSNVFNGAGTRTTGFTVANIGYNVKSNSGLQNFVATGSMYWENQTGTMSLKSSEGFKKITGNTSNAVNLQRFTHTSPNRLTYTGKETITVKVNCNLAAYYSTGGAFIASISIAKNGSAVTGGQSGFTIYSADEPCSTDLQISLSTNDYIEIFIKKFVGGATNIVVSFLNVQINELS